MSDDPHPDPPVADPGHPVDVDLPSRTRQPSDFYLLRRLQMTAQPGLNPGDKVTLTIDATVVTLDQGLLSYSYPLTDGTAPVAHVVLDSGAVTIDHLTPANWPPQAGDLWRDCENSLWFVFEGPKSNEPLMTCNYEVQEPPASVLQEWGPLVLVRREGQDEPVQPPTLIPAEDTVPIGGVAPESLVVHPGWNDGHPVMIVSVEDHGDVACVNYRDAEKPWYSKLPAMVPSDMQVTPWTPVGGAL